MRLQLGVDHARILRLIGQDLQSLFPERLEIELSGKDFIAHGHSRPQVSAPRKAKEGSLLGKIWQKLNPATEPNPLDEPLIRFKRIYTPKDIGHLDEVQASRRMDAAQKDEGRKPDLYSLQERLRIVGKLVDEKHSELIKICYDANTISFEYRDVEGEIHDEEYSTLALYKLQQEYYSKRKLTAGESWQRIRERG